MLFIDVHWKSFVRCRFRAARSSDILLFSTYFACRLDYFFIIPDFSLASDAWNCVVICHQFCVLSICEHISVELSLSFCVVVVSVASKVLIVSSNKCVWGTFMRSMICWLTLSQDCECFNTVSFGCNVSVVSSLEVL